MNRTDEKGSIMTALIRIVVPLLVLFFTPQLALASPEDEAGSPAGSGIMDQRIVETEEGLVTCRRKASDGSLEAHHSIPIGREGLYRQDRVLWERPEGWAICEDCDLSGNGEFAVLSWSLNDCRWEFFETRTGTLLWTMDPADHGLYAGLDDLEADLSDDGSVIAVCTWGQDVSPPGETKTVLYKLDFDTGKPEWKFVFPYPLSMPVNIRVTPDGSKIVCLLHGDAPTRPSELYVFDSASSVPLVALDLPFDYFNPPMGLDISDDAGRIAVSMYSKINIFDGSGTRLAQFDNPKKWQFAPAISSDGNRVVYGNFYGDLVLCKWSGSTYQEEWHYTIPPTYSYPWIVGLDMAGDTIMVGTNEPDSVTKSGGRVRVFDVSSPAPLWVSDNFGDMVEEVSLDAAGKIGVAASWGPYPGTGSGWRTALFRTDSPVPFHALDSAAYPGSHFACEISKDGKFVVTGGKAVHARDMGHGGVAYCLEARHDLEADVTAIPAAAGGAAEMDLHAGKTNAHRGYVVFCGNSGTQPGTPLPGGMAVLPLNADSFTYRAIGLLNTSRFVGFEGALDAMGAGFARFDTLGPLPTWAVGRTLVFAYGLTDPWDFASNPVLVEIIP